jgi:hypothetical protein
MISSPSPAQIGAHSATPRSSRVIVRHLMGVGAAQGRGALVCLAVLRPQHPLPPRRRVPERRHVPAGDALLRLASPP